MWHTPGVDWGGGASAVTSTPAVEWGGGMSLAGSPTMSLAGGPITINPASATTVNRHSASNGLFVDLGYGSGYQLQRDANGRLGRASADSRLVAMINDLRTDEILRVLRTSGQAGLNQLLAQPFNVLLTWGPGAYDIDLHLTGPTGVVGSDRFHIYYAARGSLEGPPFAELIRDCICTSGSEVILLSRLNQGGVYRISAFDFGNQSTTSTELTTNAGLQLQIVRGGTAVSVGNGTTIQGGHVVFAGQPSPGEVGNTWVGVEVDPRNGSVRFVNRTRNSTGGGGGIE